jgi:hypothetical protein
LPWLDLPNDIWGWVQIMKFLTVQLLHSHVTSSLLGPNILLIFSEPSSPQTPSVCAVIDNVKLWNKACFIFQPSKVPPKIYILSCAHILLKISMPLIQPPPPPQDQQYPLRGDPHKLGTFVWGETFASHKFDDNGVTVCSDFDTTLCKHTTLKGLLTTLLLHIFCANSNLSTHFQFWLKLARIVDTVHEDLLVFLQTFEV